MSGRSNENMGSSRNERSSLTLPNSNQHAHIKRSVVGSRGGVPSAQAVSFHCEAPATTTTTATTATTTTTLVPSPFDMSSGNFTLQSPHRTLHDLLPPSLLKAYSSVGVKSMYAWQLECLQRPGVLSDSRNLIYAAPTSAGKTLVAEVLMFRSIGALPSVSAARTDASSSPAKRRKRALFVLPLVSMVAEKLVHLKTVTENTDITVDAAYGKHNLSVDRKGRTVTPDIALFTIEKANFHLNQCIKDDAMGDIGIVVVDELHMIRDKRRGCQLEFLLATIKHCCGSDVQIVAMTATLPNICDFEKWLDATSYSTDFRPVELREHMLIYPAPPSNTSFKRGESVWDPRRHRIRVVQKPSANWHSWSPESEDERRFPSSEDSDYKVVSILAQEITDQMGGVLIFCSSKNISRSLCEFLANAKSKRASSSPPPLDATSNNVAARRHALADEIDRLYSDERPPETDILINAIRHHGVAYHNADLLDQERVIIERGFRSHAILVITCTATLAAGINLPARRVVILGTKIAMGQLDAYQYTQMSGRAGRTGQDSVGDAYLVVREDEKNIGYALMKNELKSVESCLVDPDNMAHALMNAMASNLVTTTDHIRAFVRSTLCGVQKEHSILGVIVSEALAGLVKREYECVRIMDVDKKEDSYEPTALGRALFKCYLSPKEGRIIFKELEKARQNGLLLDGDLHLIYLCTPDSLDVRINWITLAKRMHNSRIVTSVACHVGVTKAFVHQMTKNRNKNKQKAPPRYERFYASLILHDLVAEKDRTDIEKQFYLKRKKLESMQSYATSHTGKLSTFCEELGWWHLKLLFGSFHARLNAGVRSDLIALMRLPTKYMTPRVARSLFDNDLKSVFDIWQYSDVFDATTEHVSNILVKNAVFRAPSPGTQLPPPTVTASKIVQAVRAYIDSGMHLAPLRPDVCDPLRDGAAAATAQGNMSRHHSAPVATTQPSREGPVFNLLSQHQHLQSRQHQQQQTSPPTPPVDERLIKCADLPLASLDSYFTLCRAVDKLPFNVYTPKREKIRDANNPFFAETLLRFIRARCRRFPLGLAIEKSAVSRIYVEALYLSWQPEEVLYLPAAVADASFLDNLVGSASTRFAEIRFSVLDAQPMFSLLRQVGITGVRPTCWRSAVVADWLLEPDEAAQRREEMNKTNESARKAKASTKRQKVVKHSFNLPRTLLGRWMMECPLAAVDTTRLNGIHVMAYEVASAVALMSATGLPRGLGKWGLREAFERELRVTKILSDMEGRGVRVDLRRVEELKRQVEVVLDIIEKETSTLVINGRSRKFDLNKRKQVADLIYTDLRHPVPAGNNRSTKKDVLEDVAHLHPFIPLLRLYRSLKHIIPQLQELLTSHVVKENEARIYAQFNQLFSTGRVAVHSPNLQAIPKPVAIVLPPGRNRPGLPPSIRVRSCYVPSVGYVFVSADYMTFEARVLSHLSEDKELSAILQKEDGDVFTDLVTRFPELKTLERDEVKKVFYAIVYGQGVTSLARHLKSSTSDAANLLDRFSSRFPGIQRFNDEVIDACRKKPEHHVRTLGNRIRKFPNINHQNAATRDAAERAVKNTMCQASAADLMKTAMVNADERLRRDGIDARMLLQVHDELLFEVAVDQVEDAMIVIKRSMEECANLGVPVRVNLKKGPDYAHTEPVNMAAYDPLPNWGDASA